MSDLQKCLDIDPEALINLELLMVAFLKTIPDIVNPIKFAPKIPKLPGSAVELFLGNLSPNLPSFKVKVPELGNITLEFKGKDLDANYGLPVFAPDGLISMIIGMVKILVGLPKMFIDVGPPPKPKIPTLDDIAKLVGISLGLQVDPLILNADFVVKFSKCLVKSMLTVLPMPG